MALISVIVPVYNVEPYLRRCVDSILAQTFTDFDLILVEDGSPDQCGSICDEYAARDSRVHVIHQKNQGVSAARNTGLDYVFRYLESQWIAFIDSDDWVHRSYFAKLLAAALENNCEISMCKFTKTKATDINPQILGPDYIASPDEVYIAEDKNGVNAYPWGRLYQKKLLENLGFPVGKIYEDMIVTPQILFRTRKIAVVNEVLYFYFMNPTSLLHIQWDIRNLDVIEAYEFNLNFLKNRDDSLLQQCLARGYLNSTYDGFCSLIKWMPGKCGWKYRHSIRTKLRQGLKKYAQVAGYNFREHAWLYQVAYPITGCIVSSLIRGVEGIKRNVK